MDRRIEMTRVETEFRCIGPRHERIPQFTRNSRAHMLRHAPPEDEECKPKPSIREIRPIRGKEVPEQLHPVVVRPATAFRWDPRNDLVRILNVAGLAVHAVRWIQADALAIRLASIIHQFVDVGRTEMLAWAPKFLHATRIADIR